MKTTDTPTPRERISKRWAVLRKEGDPFGKKLPSWAKHLAIGGYLDQGWAAFDQEQGGKMVAGGEWGEELLLMRDGSIACTAYPDGRDAYLARIAPPAPKQADAILNAGVVEQPVVAKSQNNRPDPWRDHRGYCNNCRRLMCVCNSPTATPSPGIDLAEALRHIERDYERALSGETNPTLVLNLIGLTVRAALANIGDGGGR